MFGIPKKHTLSLLAAISDGGSPMANTNNKPGSIRFPWRQSNKIILLRKESMDEKPGDPWWLSRDRIIFGFEHPPFGPTRLEYVEPVLIAKCTIEHESDGAADDVDWILVDGWKFRPLWMSSFTAPKELKEMLMYLQWIASCVYLGNYGWESMNNMVVCPTAGLDNKEETMSGVYKIQGDNHTPNVADGNRFLYLKAYLENLMSNDPLKNKIFREMDYAREGTHEIFSVGSTVAEDGTHQFAFQQLKEFTPYFSDRLIPDIVVECKMTTDAGLQVKLIDPFTGSTAYEEFNVSDKVTEGARAAYKALCYNAYAWYCSMYNEHGGTVNLRKE